MHRGHLDAIMRAKKENDICYVVGCGYNGLLHYTHALEHPLSAVKHELSHGLGLAMLLPAVIKNIFAAKAETLKYILEPIAGKVNTVEVIACGQALI